MFQNTKVMRIAVILLFASSFALIGWITPILYATYVPTSSVIEVDNYKAQDTTVNSESHYVCFDRDVKNGISGEVVTELYLIGEDDNRVEVNVETFDTYFEQGERTVVLEEKLPENIEPGQYRYVAVTKIELASGQVTREISFNSEKFNVSNGSAVEPNIPQDC